MMVRISIFAALCLASAGLMAQEKSDLHTALEPFISALVATDGSGDYSSLQQAVDAAPNYGSEEYLIFLKKGEYREKVLIPASKTHLTLIGEDADSTIVVWDDDANMVVDGSPIGTFKSESVRIDANDFKAINLTFENDARPNGEPEKGQNVAVACYGDRSIFLHCRFIAWQDTYYSGSDDRQYFKDCYIEGAVDYIFGHSTVVFDSCQIHTVRSAGYITAASTQENYNFGYVFRHCNITAPPGIANVYLGRPWKTYARTVFYECNEFENVSSVGWHVWGGREETCFYAEYNCSGPGSDTTNRVSWSHQLSAGEAAAYSRENIFSKSSSSAFSGDWDPGLAEDTLWTIVGRVTPMFMDPVNTDARIAGLLVDGEELPGWDPGVYEYSIEMESASAPMPVLSASAVNPLARVEISYPESLPGFSDIVVLARDGATHTTYRVYFSVDGSYSDSSLDSIRIANRLVEDFDPEVLEYQVTLPEGTSKYYGITGYARVQAARVKVEKPASLPGTATITVDAVDGQSSSVYLLHISLATALDEDVPAQGGNFSVRSLAGNIEVDLLLEKRSDLLLRIVDLGGRSNLSLPLKNLDPGQQHMLLDHPAGPGIYLIFIEGQDFQWSEKIYLQ